MSRTNKKRFFQCWSWDGERVRRGAARDNCGQHRGPCGKSRFVGDGC